MSLLSHLLGLTALKQTPCLCVLPLGTLPTKAGAQMGLRVRGACPNHRLPQEKNSERKSTWSRSLRSRSMSARGVKEHLHQAIGLCWKSRLRRGHKEGRLQHQAGQPCRRAQEPLPGHGGRECWAGVGPPVYPQRLPPPQTSSHTMCGPCPIRCPLHQRISVLAQPRRGKTVHMPSTRQCPPPQGLWHLADRCTDTGPPLVASRCRCAPGAAVEALLWDLSLLSADD